MKIWNKRLLQEMNRKRKGIDVTNAIQEIELRFWCIAGWENPKPYFDPNF